MIKILFLTPKLYSGGIEKSLYDLVKNLDANKYEITIISLLDEGKQYQEMIQKYARVKILFKNNDNLFCRMRNLGLRWLLNCLPPRLQWRLVVGEAYDVEIGYAHGMITRIIAGSPNNSRRFAWIHNDISDMKLTCFPVTDKMMQAAYRKFDMVYSVSRAAANAFEKRYGIPSGVQYNVVDTEEILQKSQEYKWNHSEHFMIVTVGRLEKIKGFDRLLRVHKRLLDEGYVHDLCIIGEGTEREALETYVQQNHLTESVIMPGFLDNPYPVISAGDLFVCSSVAEGVSLAICEAIVLEIPVVSTYVCGSEELFGNSEYGLVVENSEEGLYSGMKHMLSERMTYEHYKEKIRQRKVLFDKESVIHSFDEIMEK